MVDALVANCPKCQAPAGEPCKDGKGKPRKQPHQQRRRRADPQEEHWRQARLKTERERKQVVKELPLFAEQALQEVRTPEENYWRTRMGKEMAGYGEPRAGFFEDWDTVLLMALAKRHLPPGIYETAVVELGRKWGPPKWYWMDLLTGGRKVVLRYYRHVFGCRSNIPSPYYDGPPFIVERHVEVGELVTWPPEGYLPPLTREEVKALLAVPPPLDFGDDGGLAEMVDRMLAEYCERKEMTP